MSTNVYNTTITDKNDFEVQIIDTEKFSKLNVTEKEIFETLRNSMLELMPLNDKNIHDDEALRYAENYAFIGLKVFNKNVIKIVDLKIKELEDRINQRLNLISSSIKVTSTLKK